MKFIEYYKSGINVHLRGNYIIEAAEGYGKTTMLKKLYNDCREDLIAKRGNIIPIYIRMADINVKPASFISNGVIFGFVQEQFFNTNNGKASIEQIIGMIRESKEYRFLFLLDGLNEVVNREIMEDGLHVFDVIHNELTGAQGDGIRFMDYPNVDIIVTTRNKAVISEELYEKKTNDGHRLFKLIHLAKLKSELDKDIELIELLSTPMLAAMYKKMEETISEEKLSGITTKYELLSAYYNLDTVLNSNAKMKDFKDNRVETVIDQILPIVALKIETAMLHTVDQNDAGKMFRSMEERGITALVGDVIREQEIEISVKAAVDTITMMNIIDTKLRFSHDMIREFWTTKGFYYCTKYNDYVFYRDELSELFDYLLRFTDREENYDAIRQTLHLGLMETMISSQNGSIVNKEFESKLKLIDCHKYKEILFRFIYNYCSILDDELQRSTAARYAWESYEYLENNREIEEKYFKEKKYYELSGIYNSLAYSVNNAVFSGHDGEEVLSLLEKADEIVKMISFEGLSGKRIKRIKILRGKIYNNFGASYYGAYFRDYKKALEWHKKAREYRKENGIDLCASYRVIASDYFMMHQYRESYEEYKEFLNYISDGCGDRLSNPVVNQEIAKKAMKTRYYNEITIIILNAIGAVCKYIDTKKNDQSDRWDTTCEEMEKEITYQLDFSIKNLDRGSRIKAVDLIDKLRQKIEDIKNIMGFFDKRTKETLELLIGNFKNTVNEMQ